MWVVRDKDGKLKLFNDKPVRDWSWEDWEHTEKCEYWCRDTDKYPPVHYGSLTSLYDPNYQVTFLDSELFPDIEWEDEPLEVVLSKKSDAVYIVEVYGNITMCISSLTKEMPFKTLEDAQKYVENGDEFHYYRIKTLHYQ